MQELDDRLNSELDPFEDMCGPKSVSHGTITSWKVRCLKLHLTPFLCSGSHHRGSHSRALYQLYAAELHCQ